MAKEYFEKLSNLIEELNFDSKVSSSIKIKHFFSGAALYVNGAICVSWSPVSLAFKMNETAVKRLIGTGEAIPLRYFPKGHVKKGYALFNHPDGESPDFWRAYFTKSINQLL